MLHIWIEMAQFARWQSGVSQWDAYDRTDSHTYVFYSKISVFREVFKENKTRGSCRLLELRSVLSTPIYFVCHSALTPSKLKECTLIFTPYILKECTPAPTPFSNECTPVPLPCFFQFISNFIVMQPKLLENSTKR